MRAILGALYGADMQVFSEGQQLKIAGGDSVPAIQACRNGETVVGTCGTHESQGLIGQVEIVVYEFS